MDSLFTKLTLEGTLYLLDGALNRIKMTEEPFFFLAMEGVVDTGCDFVFYRHKTKGTLHSVLDFNWVSSDMQLIQFPSWLQEKAIPFGLAIRLPYSIGQVPKKIIAAYDVPFDFSGPTGQVDTLPANIIAIQGRMFEVDGLEAAIRDSGDADNRLSFTDIVNGGDDYLFCIAPDSGKLYPIHHAALPKNSLLLHFPRRIDNTIIKLENSLLMGYGINGSLFSKQPAIRQVSSFSPNNNNRPRR